MGVVYHGSKFKGLKRIEPKKSTHGTYVYATPEKVLALHFSKRCGDDLVYDLGHFSSNNGPWELVEKVPGAFEKMYYNSSSIYSFSDETFKDIHTGFEEVVSEVGVDVISEEECKNVWDGILAAEKSGLIKIYRYPNKPEVFKIDNSDILDKWRMYKYHLNKEFSKDEFDRLAFLHPNLIFKINELAKEFGYNYHYEINNLVDIFEMRIQRQLQDFDHEQYIDCAYTSICAFYPEIKEQIDILYNEYQSIIKPNRKR